MLCGVADIPLEEEALSLLKVFVYGTLKPGERNYQRYCGDRVVEAKPAIARGRLFDLPLGYPALLPGDSPVWGVLLSFADAGVLHDLDELEDYDPQRGAELNEYCRCQIEVFHPPISEGGRIWADCPSLGLAWAYLMAPDRVRSLKGAAIASGWWGAGEPPRVSSLTRET